MFFLAEALLAGLTTALFGGADIRSSNISRGAVVNPEPILSIAGGGEATLDDRHTFGARVWMCNHLTDARDHIMRRCFNEIDPFLYYRNRWPICENGTLMSETGPTWVLSPAFRAPYRSNTEVEWRFRQEWINPYVTPFYYVRWGFHPAVKTYWQTGVKRTFSLCERLMLTPFFMAEWGDRKLFESKYGPARNGHYTGGLSALDAGVRVDYPLGDSYSLFLEMQEFALVNTEARRTNRRRRAVNNQNDRFMVMAGFQFRW